MLQVNDEQEYMGSSCHKDTVGQCYKKPVFSDQLFLKPSSGLKCHTVMLKVNYEMMPKKDKP